MDWPLQGPCARCPAKDECKTPVRQGTLGDPALDSQALSRTIIDHSTPKLIYLKNHPIWNVNKSGSFWWQLQWQFAILISKDNSYCADNRVIHICREPISRLLSFEINHHILLKSFRQPILPGHLPLITICVTFIWEYDLPINELSSDFKRSQV